MALTPALGEPGMTYHSKGFATGPAADRLAGAGSATGIGAGTGGAGEGLGAGGVHTHTLAGGRAVAWLRALLLAGWLAGWAKVAITALYVGQFPTSLTDLKAAIAAGQVHEVTSVGTMGAGVSG